jgi:DNA-directed RNA polymerase sigma subunit (sigma70/sigma32)
MTEEIDKINSKLAKLETHVINLIIPIQEISLALKSSSNMEKMIELLQRPLMVDDRSFKLMLSEFYSQMQEFKKISECLDITQTLDEIKYIGNRLNKIEKDIAEMKKEGIRKNVSLEFRCDGYEMVKKTVTYQKEDAIVPPEQDFMQSLLDTLNEKEAKVLIYRFGLFGEKKKTLLATAKLFGLTSGESVRRIEANALRKLRHPSRIEKVKLCNHDELKKAVTGD